MAPPEDNVSEAAATEENSSQSRMTPPEKASADGRPISTVLIIIAMQTEALPLVNKFQLSEDTDGSLRFPKGVPWVRYHGSYKELHINLIWPGKDSVLGVDSVGTISASLVTYASIQALKPDLIINAGTAGGFKAKGACIGDVYLASDVAFHDRRIPIPVFDMYGIGARRTFSTPNLLKELNLKVGKLSTGDSLDMSPQDEASILTNDATIKDMEILILRERERERFTSCQDACETGGISKETIPAMRITMEVHYDLLLMHFINAYNVCKLLAKTV